mmetsp:Transcript_198/g.682  ORF Transcript_198/g.682 Transcript_198/m.682 type:complete len:155 (-) Transcript_198:119-583(-)|eukprot:3546853-Prymnesium_polylepis.1
MYGKTSDPQPASDVEDLDARQQLKESLAQSLARERELMRMKAEVEEYMDKMEAAALDSFEGEQQTNEAVPNDHATAREPPVGGGRTVDALPSLRTTPVEQKPKAATVLAHQAGDARGPGGNPFAALFASFMELGGANNPCLRGPRQTKIDGPLG